MSYIVLARKYRPQTFKEIYSQEHITQILANAIKSNRIAHAYLFTGPRGVGKTSMARILAKSLNCLSGPSDTPCGECHNCKEITASTSTDVIEIDGASNTGVDDVRDLQRELFYAPSQSLYKIYIIDEVHMLSKSAFNALLKTLEEPPENVIFIFATTEPHKVLPTIISRCQRFDFRRIPIEGITARLKEIAEREKIIIDEESLYLIARKSDGGMRDALSLLDQILSFSGGEIKISQVLEVFGELPLTMYANITKAIFEHNPIKLIQLYHEVISQGVDLIEFIISYLEFLRQLIMLKLGISLKGMAQEDAEILSDMIETVNINNLMYMISVLIQLKQDMRTSSHPSLMIEVVLIKMSRMDEMESLSEILSRLEKVNDVTPSNKQTQSRETPKPIETKTEPKATRQDLAEEINYVPPKIIKALTKEFVIEHWDEFLERLSVQKKMLPIYLKKENISSVKSDVIFMDFNSSHSYKMVSDCKEELNDFLSKYFDLPVKLITRLTENAPVNAKLSPTLQEIQQSNPNLAKLIEITDSLIISE
jgi:DNA polymerase-3 subunit gamma/tau